jgi:hypothetical protein
MATIDECIEFALKNIGLKTGNIKKKKKKKKVYFTL